MSLQLFSEHKRQKSLPFALFMIPPRPVRVIIITVGWAGIGRITLCNIRVDRSGMEDPLEDIAE